MTVKLWDITRDLLTAPVYAGDPHPTLETLSSVALGDAFTVSALRCCTHNGTHIDAPLHAFPEGTDVASLPLEAMVGECSVVTYHGVLLGDEAERLVPRLLSRVLFRGNTEISPSAAFVLGDAGIQLVGVEGASVAPTTSETAVHRELLSRGIVILENLDLSSVEDGRYFLFAAPIKVAGAEAAPVRAILVERS